MKRRIAQANLTNPRHREIVELARQKGFLSTEELARTFSVTSQTIRRDVNELADRGLLRRYHGGAGPASSIENVGYNERQSLFHDEKTRIARLLAAQIPDNASLFINIGTTTEEVAKALSEHKNLRIITNNLNVATQLCDTPSFEVIVAGGVVRPDRGVIGESTVDFFRQFKVDFGIIGISGIDTDGALLDFDYREVRVAQTIIENARQVFLATDHTKFTQAPMVRLGHITEIDAVFTDRQPPDNICSMLENAQVKLFVAPGEEQPELQASGTTD